MKPFRANQNDVINNFAVVISADCVLSVHASVHPSLNFMLFFVDIAVFTSQKESACITARV